ncbi:hypothetical protein [Carnobacterium maltaromaticum]|uniref:hypothetical protein n=1 Tax=Carnobacterium maltaromaticum TaxID=2751 RepID=UPI0019E443A8|nr:hypothetical protein [Carnobacterium maltaromaticum]CAD5901370.1 putative membrane protein [Carnobacterium maltaromaticum]
MKIKIKEIIQGNLILRIVLYLLIGIPVGLLMIDNEIVAGLGIMLLFLTVLKTDSSKKRKRKNKI